MQCGACQEWINKQIKMASGAPIHVCVLEGQYTKLSNLGFPDSLVMELHDILLFRPLRRFIACV